MRRPASRLGSRLGLLAALSLSLTLAPAPGGALRVGAATPNFAETVTTFSQSGQFVVTGPRTRASPVLETQSPGNKVRELTPQTLAISCERVKSQLLGVLELPDTWRQGQGATGKILVNIDASVRTNRSIAVQASPFERGWQFRVALPTRIDEDRLVRALTQALVMELVSRGGNQRLGEPPLWLVEGLTQAVLASAPEGVILQPHTRATTVVRLDETLAKVRARLARQAPLSFHELSQPDLSLMDDRQWAHYSACAHLCVRELIRMPDGRARLLGWLGSLQTHWNWQTGFTEAFNPVFRSLLDAEKWWALAVSHFTGRSPSATWPAPFALRKLDDALRPVGILPGSRSRASRLPIEDVIATWDFGRQVPLLRQILQQLHAIRISAPPEVAPLVFRYIDALDEYLELRGRTGLTPLMRGQAPPSAKILSRLAISRLRELDGERTRLAGTLAAPAPPAPPAAS